MANTTWLKQTPDKPLFPDLLWSRPENKNQAGKLLVVGGNLHSFAAVSHTYAAAVKAGIGSCRILLPDVLAKTLSKVFPEAEFAASTPSGSFGREALAQILESAIWADGILLAGDFGKNAETTILLESLLSKFDGQITASGDSIDDFYDRPEQLLDRANTCLVTNFGQLQKLLAGRLLLKHTMGLVQLVESLIKFAANCQTAIITHSSNQLVLAADGRVSTTPAHQPELTKIAAFAATWWLQNPTQTFESISTALQQFAKDR